MTEHLPIVSFLGLKSFALAQIMMRLNFFTLYVGIFFLDTSTDISIANSYFEFGHWKWALAILLPIIFPFLVNLLFWSVNMAKDKLSNPVVKNTGSFSSVLGHLPVYQHFR
jgi:hypothetical protein